MAAFPEWRPLKVTGCLTLEWRLHHSPWYLSIDPLDYIIAFHFRPDAMVCHTTWTISRVVSAVSVIIVHAPVI